MATPRGGRQSPDQPFVVGGEAARLLGEVEVAEHLATHPHRHPEQGVHRRMVIGEPHRRGMSGEIGQPQHPGILDQQPEHPVALRQRTDLGDLLRGQTHLVEADQPRTRRARPLGSQHAEGAVRGAGQIAGARDDAGEQVAQLQVAGQPQHRVQQRARDRSSTPPALGSSRSLAHRLPRPRYPVPRPPRRRAGRVSHSTLRTFQQMADAGEPPPADAGGGSVVRCDRQRDRSIRARPASGSSSRSSDRPTSGRVPRSCRRR